MTLCSFPLQGRKVQLSCRSELILKSSGVPSRQLLVDIDVYFTISKLWTFFQRRVFCASVVDLSLLEQDCATVLLVGRTKCIRLNERVEEESRMSEDERGIEDGMNGTLSVPELLIFHLVCGACSVQFHLCKYLFKLLRASV